MWIRNEIIPVLILTLLVWGVFPPQGNAQQTDHNKAQGWKTQQDKRLILRWRHGWVYALPSAELPV